LPFHNWPNWFNITCGPGCSAFHQSAAAEAIDYSMPTGTPVRAAAYSVASDYSGYRTDGYGWTRILRDNSGGVRHGTALSLCSSEQSCNNHFSPLYWSHNCLFGQQWKLYRSSPALSRKDRS
jgi:hypothetical protein